MGKGKKIITFEHSWLVVGQTYNGVLFESKHLKQLAQYLTLNPKATFYTLYYNRVRFTQYVGVIRFGDLTIEVLPKTDKHNQDKAVWQEVLLQMLAISLQVTSKVTTNANINIRKQSVLEAYLYLFIDEVERLVHEGLIKKYRQAINNQTALKGKLKFHQHVTKNLVHAERFYVEHQVYDRNNIFNSVLKETLQCIVQLNISDSLNQQSQAILLHFPECNRLFISEKLFDRLTFDRKTERYRKTIELARIILLNYHPDIKGGNNSILAIMFDMNLLWESYIYFILKRGSKNLAYNVTIQSQQKRLYWQHQENWSLRLKPDLVITKEADGIKQTVIVDTKWKYKSDASIEDVRQMDVYSNYFEANQSFLLYPEKLEGEDVKCSIGTFYIPGTIQVSNKSCGLLFADLLKNNRLNLDLGKSILVNCFATNKELNNQG